ncbi:MAG: hypothetical protein JWL64_1569, partial [Frankiales bacterium]|nr:hypothetical protein [Frankiales bacterium]
MAELSDHLLFAAVLLYGIAMLAFAGVSGSRRARRGVATDADVVLGVPARELVTAGAPPR